MYSSMTAETGKRIRYLPVIIRLDCRTFILFERPAGIQRRPQGRRPVVLHGGHAAHIPCRTRRVPDRQQERLVIFPAPLTPAFIRFPAEMATSCNRPRRRPRAGADDCHEKAGLHLWCTAPDDGCAPATLATAGFHV